MEGSHCHTKQKFQGDEECELQSTQERTAVLKGNTERGGTPPACTGQSAGNGRGEQSVAWAD